MWMAADILQALIRQQGVERSVTVLYWVLLTIFLLLEPRIWKLKW